MIKLSLVALFFFNTFVHAESTLAERGKARAGTCAACHGQAGISVNPVWPNLAGQKREYLMKQLQNFKAGDRKDPLMSPMAQPLTPSDMEELAAYFSELASAK